MGNKEKTPKVKDIKGSETEKKKEKASTGSKVSFIIGLVLCIILIPVIIINCALIVTSFTNPDKPPSLFGYTPMIVLTDSMEPLINEGDIIVSQALHPDSIKVGDVISFFDPESKGSEILTHRVVDIYTDFSDGTRYAITAGDNNVNRDYDRDVAAAKNDKENPSEKLKEVEDKATFVKDENKDGYEYVVYEVSQDKTPVPLTSESIIGRYVYTRVPVVGKISMFMQTTWGWVVCITVPLVAFVLYELIRRRKTDKSKKNDMDALLAELEALKAEKEAANKVEADKPETAGADAEIADATEVADPPEDSSEEN